MTRLVLGTIATSTLRYRGVFVAALWALFGIVTAFARRGDGSDHIVIAVLGGLVVPLLSFSIAAAVLSGRGYGGLVVPLMRLGAPKVPAVFGPFAVAAAASAGLAALVAVLVVALTRTAGSPAFDVFTTSWIAALGAAVYAAVFVAASALGKSGGGRSVVLVVDFVLGAGSGLGGALTVRGHLRNMLGGTAPLDLGQRVSFVFLLLLGAVALAFAWSRLAPRRVRL